MNRPSPINHCSECGKQSSLTHLYGGRCKPCGLLQIAAEANGAPVDKKIHHAARSANSAAVATLRGREMKATPEDEKAIAELDKLLAEATSSETKHVIEKIRAFLEGK